MKKNLLVPAGYAEFVDEIKGRVRAAQISAARAVNRDLILLYWDIGRGIMQRQKTLGWGEAVVETLARDLRTAFPNTQGFSPRNIWDMRRLFEAFSHPEILRHAVAELGKSLQNKLEAAQAPAADEFLRQRVAEIPWGSLLAILNKVSDPEARL